MAIGLKVCWQKERRRYGDHELKAECELSHDGETSTDSRVAGTK
jgi:hypothetical protein